MPITRSPSRPPSGSPAYSPDNLPVYRGGSAIWTPDTELAGVTNSFWAGPLASGVLESVLGGIRLRTIVSFPLTNNA